MRAAYVTLMVCTFLLMLVSLGIAYLAWSVNSPMLPINIACAVVNAGLFIFTTTIFWRMR